MKIANVLISGVWGDVSPEALNRGIGGREGALIYLSREWAKKGHEVTNFVNIEESARFEERNPHVDYDGRDSSGEWAKDGYHEYVPLNLTRPMLANFPWDVAIAWECPSTFEDHRILDNTKLRICEMQVCHLSQHEMRSAANYCDYVATLSEWHKGFVLSQGLEMDEDGLIVFPNGVDITKYPEEEIERLISSGTLFENSPQFVYSSSPDRGLWHLLNVWPKIRKEFKGASLLVGYGVEKWVDINKWAHSRAGEMGVEIERLMKQPGVKDIGKIGQDKLAELQIGADAWLYPLDSINATESGCITAVENAAAGNPIITTDVDCMASEFGRVGRIVDMPWDEDAYFKAVMDVLTDEDYYISLQNKGRKFAEGRDWSIIANEWLNLFKQYI